MRPRGRHYYAIKRLRRYGFTEVTYKAMLDAQSSVCAVCKELPATHIDHDHKTGKVRGLLCAACNRGLGVFNDDVNRLLSAMEYLIASDHSETEFAIQP